MVRIQDLILASLDIESVKPGLSGLIRHATLQVVARGPHPCCPCERHVLSVSRFLIEPDVRYERAKRT